MMRKAFFTASSVALPPTSRKLAGEPPWYLMMSMVAMARPAPFTMQPMLPSSLMKFRLYLLASIFLRRFLVQVAVGQDFRVADQGVVIEARSWRPGPVTSPCLVTTSGLISTMEQSFSTKSR